MTTFIKLEFSQITNERLERLKQKELEVIAIEDDIIVLRLKDKTLFPPKS